MPINRFYSPSRGTYVSQFVPKKLPEQLMLNMLASKQKQADMRYAQALQLGEWSQAALPGEDTRYVEGIQEEVRKFAEEAAFTDKTSPEFQRRYLELINKVRGDKDLQTIGANYAHHAKALERREELMKKGATEDAEEYWDEYNRAYNIYTTGEGFRGTTGLASNLITEGVDIQKHKEELFNHIGADSYESIKNLSGQDIYYTVKSGGKSAKKLNATAENQWYTYLTGPAGQQMQARYKAANIPQTIDGKPVTQEQWLRSLSQEERDAFNTGMYDWIKQDLVATGETFQTSTYTTTEASALNKASDRLREDRLNEFSLMTGMLPAHLENNVDMSIKAQQDAIDSQIADLTASLEGSSATRKANINRRIATLKDTKALLEAENAKQLQYYRNAQYTNENLDADLFDSDANFMTQLARNPKLLQLYNTAVLSKEGQALKKFTKSDSNYLQTVIRRLIPKQAGYSDLSTAEKGIFTNYANQTEGLLQKAADGEAQAAAYYGEYLNTPTAGVVTAMSEYTTVPTYKGSTGSREEDFINNSNFKGYTIWVDGKKVSPQSYDGQLLLSQMTDFKMAGLTNTEYMRQGIGRVGTVNKYQRIPKADGEGYETQTVPVQVVLTKNDPNNDVVGAMYAQDYFRMAQNNQNQANNLLRTEGEYNKAMAEGFQTEADIQRRRALHLISPEIARTFRDAELSNNMMTTVVKLPISAGDGTISETNIQIYRYPSGEYRLTYMDLIDNEGNPMQQRFEHAQAAEEALIMTSSEIQD